MTGDFRSWIGRPVTREDVVTRRLVDEFRATLSPHLFTPEQADIGPPGFHWCIALPAKDISELGPDGAEAKGTFLPPVPLPRRMWAGGQVETLRPLRVGQHVTRTSTITDVKQREGRTGSLCFISVTHDISTQGELAIRERHDILYRETPRVDDAKPIAKSFPETRIKWHINASSLLLFRFSAVTFNGHRIHYDLPYARDVEGYAGLLVHGPMQATLALNQISSLAGRVPKLFNYRCTAPLLSGQEFIVGSWMDADGVSRSVIADAAGIFTIEAEAHG
jgi:3-methylfumaryl-CoA hydratase